MSRFGEHVRRLRLQRGLSLKELARKLGTFKGYVCAIEKDQVNPPSVRFIKKYARLFGEDVRDLVTLAWVDKAPPIIRREAKEFLRWYLERRTSVAEPSRPGDPPKP